MRKNFKWLAVAVVFCGVGIFSLNKYVLNPEPNGIYAVDNGVYKSGYKSLDDSSEKLQWSFEESSKLKVVWRSGDIGFRLVFEPVGINGLPNVRSLEYTRDKNLKSKWLLVNRTGSDWLPPVVVKALSNGDNGDESFTGGSHGSDGKIGGKATASNVLYEVYADGKKVDPGAATLETANSIKVHVINEIQAFNTKQDGRSVLRQDMTVTFMDSGIYVVASNTAMEDIGVKVDYGFQAITHGLQYAQVLYGPTDTKWVHYKKDANDSGSKKSSPNAWAIAVKGDDNGKMLLWMDKSYGVGDGRFVADDQPLLRGSKFSKWYLGAVLSGRNNPDGWKFEKGQTYSYRAGASFRDTYDDFFIRSM